MRSTVFILLIVLMSCADDSEFRHGVGLRIVNQSSVDFDNIVVSSGGPSHDFGSLKSGRTSEYVNFDFIFRYGYIRIESDGDEYVLQPIDYVGEEKYEKGNYSYLLQVEKSGGHGYVSLEFRQD